MAIEYDISGLLGKTENEGSTNAGRLTATEWNKLVSAVQEVQTKSEGTIKGIKYNNTQVFDVIDEQGYLTMTINNPEGTLTIDLDAPDPYIARGASCPVTVRVSSKDDSGNPTAAANIVNFYLNGSQAAFYTGNVYDIDVTTPGAVKELTIDLSKIVGLPLLTGELDNEIRIEVSNRQNGLVKSSFCYVKIIDLSLNVDIFGSTNVFTESNKPQLIARVNGTDAGVTATVDGREILKNGTALNGSDTNFGTAIFDDVNTHGVHTLEVWASVTRATSEGEIVISTIPQKFNYIYGTTNTRPVVMSVISNKEPEEYSNFEMSFVAYKYNPTAVVVTDTVNVALCNVSYDTQGNPVAGTELIKVSQDVSFDTITNSGSGNVMFSLFPVNNISLVGKKAIVISIGDFSQIAEVEVKKSSVTLTQLAGYAVYLTANNRSNDEPASTVRTWRSNGVDKSGSALVVDAIFDDNIEFINTGSGWIADEDGNMAMHLRKGRFFTLDYAPFAENPTYNDSTNQGNGRGKTISIEFATRNCLDQNSKVIECLDSTYGQERGFVITASSATLKANTFSLGAEFKEDTRIRIDFVIEGKQTKYEYNTVSGKDGKEYKGSSEEALAIIYVDGVYQALKVIPASTSFLQGDIYNAAPSIRFGSNDCDLDIYSIRIYDQALTPTQIINNYSYDTPNFNDKIAIAKRNDIFDATSVSNKPNINIEKLRLARPALPFFYITQKIDENTGTDEILPQDKSNWKKLKLTEWSNPANETDKGEAAVSFKSETGRWRNQGTSSMSYPWPWRNWDWQAKFDEEKGEVGFIFGDGSTGKKWSQYKGMSDAGSIKKITLKKDYASSEMCNNAITSEYFTDMALAIGGDYPNVLSPAQRVHGAAATPYRLTFVATPCFLFQKFNDGNKNGTAGAGYEALGMMNLIPNKNECDHLGFTDKGDVKFTWEACRAQSWELADNIDDIFWYKKLNGITRNSDGTYINDVAEAYEARYPKDSTLNGSIWDGDEESDFGMVVEDKPSITAEQQNALYNEQSDIIEFHNWLVDVNRQIPEDYKAENGEYRTLTPTERDWDWNKNEDGTYNTLDTPDYRLKKFAAEAPTRLIVDQFCMYYIWRETFWGFDSGFKNLQVYTMGKATVPEGQAAPAYMQWGCMVRDADTTLGIENTGKKYFPAHIEDTDYYTKEGDVISFVYDGAKNMYHAKSIGAIGGHPVLNGQLGSLWINLRDAFGARISEIYRALANTTKANWTGSRAISRFRNHQEKWCESLYNFGMRQYFGGEPFTAWIDSGLGDKKNSRASWLDRGFYYRSSKYKNLNDCCTVRAICYETPDEIPAHNIEGVAPEYTANVPFKFKSYIPMYIGLGATEQKMSSCKNFKRVTDVENTYDIVPGPDGLNFALSETGDQNNWFFGTDQLTEIGDFARGCKIKVFQQISFPKLRELNLGHEKDRNGVEYREYYTEVQEDGSKVKRIRPFTNQYLEAIDCSSLKQLTLLDVTNHTALKTLTLTACDQLQELYAKGTDSLSTIALPATTALKTIYLGKNLVTLNLANLTSIEKFELEGADKLSQLFINNCGNYMASRSYDIMTMAITALEKAYRPVTNNNVCQFTGINWQNVSISDIERLLNIEAKLSGYININSTAGSLTNELKVRLVNSYGNIDDPANGLYITYTQQAINTIKMPNKLYIHEPGTTALTFTVNNGGIANTYSYANWTLSSNEYATIDNATGVITRNSTPAPETAPPARLKVTVYQIADQNGRPRPAVESNEVLVYFFERHAKPGDIVYHDGTFSDEKDSSKTPIGVCFYVDPNDKQKRLMVALENIYNASDNEIYKWGIGTGNSYTSNGEQVYYGSPQINAQQYGFSSMSEIIDLTSIPNVSNHGGNYTTVPQMLNDEEYRDPNTVDKFKEFPYRSYMGNMGWDTAQYDIEINYNKVIKKDESYPVGYIYTMDMIQRRDRMIQLFPDLISITGTTGRTSEYENLFSDIETAENKSLGSWSVGVSSYMYPAASLAYAYEPGGEGKINGLLNKFKKNNWFIPTSGDIIRISYYMRQFLADDSVYEGSNAFKFAIEERILKNSGWLTSLTNGAVMLSSTESGNDASKYVAVQTTGISSTINEGASYTGICSAAEKYDGGRLRPICMF